MANGKGKKSKKKLFIFSGIGVVLLALVLIVLLGSKRENVVNVQTEKVQRKSITQIASALSAKDTLTLATAGGAATAVPDAGGGAASTILGASTLAVSTLGGSTFGFSGSLGFSGCFSFTISTEIFWICLPRYPWRAAK